MNNFPTCIACISNKHGHTATRVNHQQASHVLEPRFYAESRLRAASRAPFFPAPIPRAKPSANLVPRGRDPFNADSGNEIGQAPATQLWQGNTKYL